MSRAAIDISHKKILKIAAPLIGANIVQNLIGLADSYYLSGLPTDAEYAGAQQGIILTLIFFMLAYGLTNGIQIIFARRFGENDNESIGKTFAHGWKLLMLYCGIVVAFIQLLFPFVLSMVMQSETVVDSCVEYLQVRSWGLIFSITGVLFISLQVAVGRTLIILPVALFMTIVNVLLDKALFSGLWGFPEMGIRGVALASVIAEGSSLILFVAYTVWKDQFKIYKRHVTDRDLYKRILTISYPLVAQFGIAFSGWAVFFFFVERMGETPLAISQFIRPIYVFFLIPFVGLGSVSNTLTSAIIGSGADNELVNRLLKHILQIALCFSVVLIAVSHFKAEAILYYLDRSPGHSLSEKSISTFRIAATATILFPWFRVIFNAIAGTGDTKMAFKIELITIVSYVLATYLLVFQFHTDVEYVWFAEHFYFLTGAVISYIVIKKGLWTKKNI